MFQITIVEKIKTTNFFLQNRAFYEIMWEICTMRQATRDSILRYLRFERCIIKAEYSHIHNI
jgi:hypothetical protein